MQQQEYITFTIDQEEYAIELVKVKEVTEYKKITRLPNAGLFIKGVINLRGLIVPVVDLRANFGLQSRPHTKFTVVIVLETLNKVFGIIVDTVPDVVLLSSKELQPPPSFKSLINKKYIKRIGRTKSRLIIILDTEHILFDQEAPDRTASPSLELNRNSQDAQKLQSQI
ncbi:MAG: chemotaxis protein CheW [Pseudomonadota bacterium]